MSEVRGHRREATSGSIEVDPETRAYVARVIAVVGERLKVFGDILEFDEFFVSDDQLPYDEKAFDKRLREPGAADLLRKLRDRLAATEPWQAAALDQAVKEFVDAEGIKLGQIIHALRVAVTGKSTGVGMFDCLELLGRERSLRRIDRALARV